MHSKATYSCIYYEIRIKTYLTFDAGNLSQKKQQKKVNWTLKSDVGNYRYYSQLTI